jgi:hypothetical protein
MLPAALPYIFHYGVPLVFGFGLGHLHAWIRHRKYTGQSFKDIVKQ